MAAIEAIGTVEDLNDAVPYDLWAQHAACKGRTPLFFPPKAERPQARARREHKARLLCAGCPVQVSCRDFARTNREYGYWAGESEEDRHILGFTVSAPIGIRARAFDHGGDVCGDRGGERAG